MRNMLTSLLVFIVIIITFVYAKFIVSKLLARGLIKNDVHAPHSLVQSWCLKEGENAYHAPKLIKFYRLAVH